MYALSKSKLNLTRFIIATVGFLACIQFTVFSTFWLFGFIFLLLILSSFYYLRNHKVSKSLLCFLLFFLLPSIISILSLPISFALENGGIDYSQLSFYGRIANLLILTLVILFVNKYLNKYDVGMFFRWYGFGVFILMLSALWHALSIYTSFISFPFETRDHLHSTYGNVYTFTNRVTGFAREPSYFVIFPIDFIAITLILFSSWKRGLLVCFSIILILLSLSPSGFIIFFGALLGAILLTTIKFIRRINYKSLISAVFIFILFLCVSVMLISFGLLDYIISRVANISLEESSRLYMNIMPFYWSADSNIFSFLFGHGVKSYSVIGTYYNLPSGDPIHETSNNMFVDIFWEAGFVGLMLLFCFFIYLFRKVLLSDFSKYQIFIMFYILIDLFLSAFFRADFASLRFFMMLYLLYSLTLYDFRLLRKKL